MTSILVVEDAENKWTAYHEILMDQNVLDESIEHCTTINDAKRALRDKQYDIMILDLVLPRRQDSDPEADGGKELLLEIVEPTQTYHLPRNIFAVSAFDESMHELEKYTEQFFFTLIKYDPTSSVWRTTLSNYLSQILQATQTAGQTYQYDAAILCALHEPELEQVLALPFDWKPYNVLGDSTDYYSGRYGPIRLICAACYEMGMPAAAILSTKIIHLFHPKYLIMTGIAGCAKEGELQFGDIMIADPCFDYGSGKRVVANGISAFQPGYRQQRLDWSVQQKLRRLIGDQALLDSIKASYAGAKPESALSAKIGPFGSGASVLADGSIVRDVQTHARKLLGFDMEAYAVMLSGFISSNPRPVPIVIKSVSDFGSTEKNDDYQDYAAYTSAQLLPRLFDQLFSL